MYSDYVHVYLILFAYLIRVMYAWITFGNPSLDNIEVLTFM